MASPKQTVLITGFPSNYLAIQVLRKVAEAEPDASIVCVVPERFRPRADDELQKLAPAERHRVRILEGDAAAMDLGLAGTEFIALAEEVRTIHHCAAITYLGVEATEAERVNVGSAREVLELASVAAHLDRIVHWSTALVSGARRGFVLETELDGTSGFRNPIEETRHRAERLLREAGDRYSITILRPSLIVGNSQTGEIDRFEGLYLLVLLMLGSPADLRLPLPARGDIPLNVVPIDFVVDAGWAIVQDPRSIGRTFHLVDPDPLPIRTVFELIAQAAGRPVPRGFLPTALAAKLLKTPGLERFAHAPRAFLEQLTTEVVYDDRNARELLAGKGLRCPRFEDYVQTIVDFARRQQHERRSRSVVTEAIDDPLA